MLVLAPAACCLAGIAASEALLTLSRSVRARLSSGQQDVLKGSINLEQKGQAEPAVEEPPAAKASSKRSAKKAADPSKVSSPVHGTLQSPAEAAAALQHVITGGPAASGILRPATRQQPFFCLCCSANSFLLLLRWNCNPQSQLLQGKGVWALPFEVAVLGLVTVGGLLIYFTVHSVWVSSEMYSAPSIVLQSRTGDGGVHVFDDFRESYAWLNYNTHPNAKVGRMLHTCTGISEAAIGHGANHERQCSLIAYAIVDMF